MPFFLLLLLALTCLPIRWPTPPEWLGPLGSSLAIWLGCVVLAGGTGVLAWYYRRRLRLQPDVRSSILKRFSAWRRTLALLLLVYYLVALSALGWGQVVQESWPADTRILPGLQVALLAPLFLGLTIVWIGSYRLEHAAHGYIVTDRPFPKRLSYLGLQARHHMLLLVPPLFLLTFEQSLFFCVPQLQEPTVWLPFLAVGLLALAFLSIPLLLRWFLGLKPLPPCPLRDRLENAAKRIGLKFSDILVWDTRWTVANAMVTGVFPFLRYIIITDRLMQDLTHEEVEAVFGHEVGHVKHHHMLFYILFLLGSIMVLGAVGQFVFELLQRDAAAEVLGDWAATLVGWIENYEMFVMLPLTVLVACYIFIVFGYVSRRCERQADVFGARATSSQTFIDALEKVARINGIPREKPGWLSSWQHGTIAQRVGFLQHLKDNPAMERDFQKSLGVLKWAMVIALAGFLSLMLVFLGPERVWDMLKHM